MELKALRRDLKLSDARERDIDPDNAAIHLGRLIRLENGQIVCVLSAAPDESGSVLYVLSDKEMKAVPGCPEVDKAWAAGTRILVLDDRRLKLVETTGSSTDLLDLPEKTASVDATWLVDGVRLVAAVAQNVDDDPELWPSERRQDDLMYYSPASGWKQIGEIPAGCWSLSLSADGTRCTWREAVNIVPEEAMRGEIRACELATGEIRDLTDGAGQARSVLMIPDGSGVVCQANFEKERPITTHLSLWRLPWDGGDPVRLTEAGRCVEDFGWIDDERLWVSFVDGTNMTAEAVGLDGSASPYGGATLSEVVPGDEGDVFVTGDVDRFPYISSGKNEIVIPQPEDFADLSVRLIEWKASDGLAIQGVVYEAASTPDGAPLLVRAHGGPAGDVILSRDAAIRHRHLLRAGYRILEPAFRGTLGFGDDFLGANIGCQGVADLDDLVTGVDRLIEMGVADGDRVGIFGGSYGGYMTLRAVAVTDRFKTGVALYGFIDNRWMTLETGDFTYEDEYIAPVTWPMKQDAVKSDVFSHLHEIDCPLLLLHGDQDPICTLSQSKIVYRALEHRGVTAGLVVYPGEGHGFRKPEHRRDCDRRTLAWFEEFLPV